MTRATKFIREAANRFKEYGSVDWDSAFQTVEISWGNDPDDSCFMQGDEADSFIAEVEALCKRYPSLDEYTAACSLAEPYAETLAN